MILKDIISKKSGKHFYKLGVVGYLKKVKFTNWVFIGKLEFLAILNSFHITKKLSTDFCITYFVSSNVLDSIDLMED